MLRRVLIVILVAIAGLLGYAATRPDSFKVERSAIVAAPAEKIYSLIIDMKGFNRWNPWAVRDPAMKLEFVGPASGLGAAYSWDSASMGAGRMEVVEALPPTRASMKLDIARPMQANNKVEFTLAPEGERTRVNWAMSGPQPFVTKLFTLFVEMDRMIGPDFEEGLANLKKLAEAS